MSADELGSYGPAFVVPSGLQSEVPDCSASSYGAAVVEGVMAAEIESHVMLPLGAPGTVAASHSLKSMELSSVSPL